MLLFLLFLFIVFVRRSSLFLTFFKSQYFVRTLSVPSQNFVLTDAKVRHRNLSFRPYRTLACDRRTFCLLN